MIGRIGVSNLLMVLLHCLLGIISSSKKTNAGSTEVITSQPQRSRNTGVVNEHPAAGASSYKNGSSGSTAAKKSNTPPMSRGFYANTNHKKTILIESMFFIDPPGGVEAMIQLTIALCQAAKNCSKEVFITTDAYHEKWLAIYGDKLIHRTKKPHDLKHGDLYIINEGVLCQAVPEGVHEFVWLLASYRGCNSTNVRFISHNQHLTTFEGLKLPKERVIHPYLSPPLVEDALLRTGLTPDGVMLYERSAIRSRKIDLVLVDNDVPNAVYELIKEAAAHEKGQVLYLDNLNRTQMVDAYEQAKVMIDWCMRGSERCPLESALFGAITVSNMCDTGRNFADFPVPQEYLLPWSSVMTSQNDQEKLKEIGNGPEQRVSSDVLKERLQQTFRNVFDNYWDILPQFEPLRRSILDHNPSSMVREASRFLSTVYISDDHIYSRMNKFARTSADTGSAAPRQSSELMPGGCKQC